jgi:hypothetical protein
MGTPTVLKFSHSTSTCLWRWNRQSVSKHRHIQFRRPGNNPEENIQHTEHGESLKSRILQKIVASGWKLYLNVIVKFCPLANVRTLWTRRRHFGSYSAANLLTIWAVIGERNSCFIESFQLFKMRGTTWKKMLFEVLGLEDTFCETVHGGIVGPLIMSWMKSSKWSYKCRKIDPGRQTCHKKKGATLGNHLARSVGNFYGIIVISGSLPPRHVASSGCGWRNGLRYVG